jgi:hypothetical protein
MLIVLLLIMAVASSNLVIISFLLANIRHCFSKQQIKRGEVLENLPHVLA